MPSTSYGPTPDPVEPSKNYQSDFDTPTSEEQAALCYWIKQTMKGADRLEPSTSYGLKHQFEEEGFYVTNGQFKGAMLTVGFVPKDDTKSC